MLRAKSRSSEAPSCNSRGCHTFLGLRQPRTAVIERQRPPRVLVAACRAKERPCPHPAAPRRSLCHTDRHLSVGPRPAARGRECSCFHTGAGKASPRPRPRRAAFGAVWLLMHPRGRADQAREHFSYLSQLLQDSFVSGPKDTFIQLLSWQPSVIIK